MNNRLLSLYAKRACLATIAWSFVVGVSFAVPTEGTPSSAAAPPLSLLELMRASVEIPADGLWAIQGAEHNSDDVWLLADQDSINLAAAAMLITKTGSGKNDRRWVANADWQSWARDVQQTALTLRAAAKGKDQVRFDTAADHLAEVCQNCHIKYRPETPSDGVARYPFYPKRVLAK